LPPASKNSNLVTLFCKPIKDIRSLYCCGLIGIKKRKMCLALAGDCSVSRHGLLKFDFPSELREGDVVVFINAPTRDSSSPAVFTSPCIAASALSVDIEVWRDELLEVHDWQSWLSTMSSEAVRNGDTVKLDLAKLKFDLLPPGKTPLKKLRYVLPSSPREDDWEGVLPTPDGLPEGSSLDMVVDTLKAGWPIMVRNAEDTASRLTTARTNLREFQASVSGDMTVFDLQLQDLTNFLGSHPLSVGTMSAWEAIQDSAIDNAQAALEVSVLTKTVSSLTMRVQALRSPVEMFSDGEFQRNLQQSVAGAVSAALGPFKQSLLDFAKFFWTFTTKTLPLVPGNLLEQRLSRLDQPTMSNINPLGAGWGNVGQDPTRINTGVTWNNPGLVNNGGASSSFHASPSNSQEVDALRAEFAQMKATIDGLRAEIHSDRVHCGGALLTSQQFATNWIVKHGLGDKTELFLDLVSLLSLSFHSLDYDMDEIKFDEHAAKRGSSGSTNDAIYELSFRKELPAVFGRTPQNGVARNARTLPTLPTFGDWDTQLGMNGARHVMAHNIRQTIPALCQMMTLLPPEAQAVALELANDADRRQVALASHMTNHFVELQQTSASNEKEIWMLVSAGVREFFRHLAEKRFIAKRLSPMLTLDQRAGYYLWGTLQENSSIKEWMAADFKNHPRIAPMLTLHLFEHRVPTSDHDALIARVASLKKELPSVRSIADTARTAADAKKKKGTPAGGS
jgi:hypothetical protein